MDRRQFFAGIAGLATARPKVSEAKTPDLTLADTIDILTDYEVVHKAKLFDSKGQASWGITDYMSRSIQLADCDRTQKRLIVIHEFLHVYNRLHGIEQDEEIIDKKVHEIYKKLYE